MFLIDVSYRQVNGENGPNILLSSSTIVYEQMVIQVWRRFKDRDDFYIIFGKMLLNPGIGTLFFLGTPVLTGTIMINLYKSQNIWFVQTGPLFVETIKVFLQTKVYDKTCKEEKV